MWLSLTLFVLEPLLLYEHFPLNLYYWWKPTLYTETGITYLQNVVALTFNRWCVNRTDQLVLPTYHLQHFSDICQYKAVNKGSDEITGHSWLVLNKGWNYNLTINCFYGCLNYSLIIIRMYLTRQQALYWRLVTYITWSRYTCVFGDAHLLKKWHFYNKHLYYPEILIRHDIHWF